MPTINDAVLRMFLLIVVLMIAACSGGPPTVKIVGGGFIFNYRIAEAYYGIVAEIGGDVPAGAVLIAEFEDPAGGEAIAVSQAIIAGRPRYKLETPPLTGIQANRDYRVVLHLFAADREEVLAEATRSFKSNVGQDVMPDRPLSIGPGYHRPPLDNPENK